MALYLNEMRHQEFFHFPVGMGYEIKMAFRFNRHTRQPFKMAERDPPGFQYKAFELFMHDNCDPPATRFRD